MSVLCAIAALTPAAALLRVPLGAWANTLSERWERSWRAHSPPLGRVFHCSTSFAARTKVPSVFDSMREVMLSVARRLGCQKKKAARELRVF